MRLRIITLIIIFMTTIFTVKAFLDFQKRWKATERFQKSIINTPIFLKHLLIPPKQLGVDMWHPGDYAAYQFKTNEESDQFSFYVASRGGTDDSRHWLRTQGLTRFNDRKIELWRLLSETSLLPGDETDGFFFTGDSFLIPVHSVAFPSYSVILEDMGTEIVKTLVGDFECQHYFAGIRSPIGKFIPILEVWANPSVRPLGIVKLRWRDETLDLVDLKAPLSVETPIVNSKILNPHVIRDQGCAGCHEKEIGGKDLKFPSRYRLSAKELNLTKCLFHYHQDGLVKTSDLVRLQTILRLGQFNPKEFVQFTWRKGSFWVKTDPVGKLAISLDSLVIHENLRVLPQRGALILNLEK